MAIPHVRAAFVLLVIFCLNSTAHGQSNIQGKTFGGWHDPLIRKLQLDWMTRLLWSTSARSVTECGLQCSASDTCQIFKFATGTCSLFDYIEHPAGNTDLLGPVDDHVFFAMPGGGLSSDTLYHI